ncbi:hypothetical protein F5X68DRAFT_45115 [Plectosphaerella plurivora]|uniref:Protein kinase domain-containing protein n=1 Tax=Plectosphaerella plurivora TaxID=936078 RepID=A0A9P8VH02_9PEZI|nr:hypothetical protein F5X68DRAFT_45115 [Plectosphaerella plurivora]
MEGLPTGGYELQFQRQLSRLYDDTKKSSDFVSQSVQNAEDPDIKVLHRKLRIQKDRFVSWGVEWSDTNQTAEIDESLTKAGLSEIVGSILSTIRDILAEAEPLWQSSKSLVGRNTRSEKSKADLKLPIVEWDKGRFEDLIRDLTTSVDTLYDLSRTRSGATLPHSSRPKGLKSQSSMDVSKSFESTRIQTPQLLDPSTFTGLRSMQSGASFNALESTSRDVVFMDKQAWANLVQTIGRQTWAPLLLEFAPFDPIYASTGISPPMTRFEKLSAGLHEESRRSPNTWTGLPRLLGYFEDFTRHRIGLVYQFPPTFNAVSIEDNADSPVNDLSTLGDLLNRPDFEPRLEAKFRLANNLANTVFDLHARGVTHGNLIDSSITFCNTVGGDKSGSSIGEVDIRRPLVSSFDLFPEAMSEVKHDSSLPLYRHPLDPRTLPGGPITDKTDTRILDLYSLAMLLVSIGLWTKLEYLVPDPSSPSIPESILQQLAIRCGTLYMKAVQACWDAVDQELAGKASGEVLLSNVHTRTSRYLEACCILDGVSGLDERLSQDLGDVPIVPKETKKVQHSSPSQPSLETSGSRASPRLPPPSVDIKQPIDVKPARANIEKPLDTASKPSVKTRMYPQVPLAPEIIEQWNDFIMPQINQALRTFYRKNPETVEISLQPVGPSVQKARPTVLVVCTSVSKVKAILIRKLGVLFDADSEFGLKVCKGQVLRSRKQPADPRRSHAGADDADAPKAANPDWQERPNNGASIGAWIGDRHLPPVSFGGLVIVDDKPYGMTVHHMLDDQEQMQGGAKCPEPLRRSMARPDDSSLQAFYADSTDYSSGSDDYSVEFSDSESEGMSETDITSDMSDDESDDGDFDEPGDIPGIEPGLGEGYIVTQPAMDDVDDDFYPSSETADEDHLTTFGLGEIYASSGIRRREQNGLVHEIDWALFEFQDHRLPDDNSIPRPRSNSTSTGAGSKLKSDEGPVCGTHEWAADGPDPACQGKHQDLWPGLAQRHVGGEQPPFAVRRRSW